MEADDLDDETKAAIREGLEQAKRREFVPDDEIEALWQRFGLTAAPSRRTAML
jgi:predicted transcriptional regulator